MCQVLDIPEDWHYLIVGDGSATKWKHAGGWASTVLWKGRSGNNRKTFSGGMNCCTNIIGEMLAFVHPLMWLASSGRLPKRGFTNVHVLTDCEIVKEWGCGRYARNTHEELWFMVSAFARKGIVVNYHWIPRDTIDLNKFAHEMANHERIFHKEDAPGKRRTAIRDSGGSTIYDLNP